MLPKQLSTNLLFPFRVTAMQSSTIVILQSHMKVERYLHSVVSLLPETLKEKVPNELLFGRAGTCPACSSWRDTCQKSCVNRLNFDQIMRKVFGVVIHSGHGGKQHDQPAQRVGDDCDSLSYLAICYSCRCLKYLFFGADYIGAAHGTAGILFVLLQFKDWCREPHIAPWIQQTLDHLLSLQYKSGNFPTKDYSDTRVDELVHWCHGAPGFANLLHQAYEVYNDDKYLCGLGKISQVYLEIQWVLRKGFGLCHGVCGNAYPFLTLYSSTQKDEYYYCATTDGIVHAQ